MSSYAYIVDNQAVQTITPPAGHVLADCLHPSLVGLYTAIPDGVVVGATYNADADTWTNPDATAVASPEADEATQLAAARATRLAAINAAAQAALATLASGYPDWEVSSWDQQLREAQLVAADNALADDLAEGATDAIPLVRQMATARLSLGDTTAARIITLSERIIANAAAWSVAAGTIIGQRQALEDAVNAAATPAAVAAITITIGV